MKLQQHNWCCFVLLTTEFTVLVFALNVHTLMRQKCSTRYDDSCNTAYCGKSSRLNLIALNFYFELDFTLKLLRSRPACYDRRNRWESAVWLLQTQLCVRVASVRPICWLMRPVVGHVYSVHVILHIYHTVIKHAGTPGFWCTSVTLRQRQPKNPEISRTSQTPSANHLATSPPFPL